MKSRQEQQQEDGDESDTLGGGASASTDIDLDYVLWTDPDVLFRHDINSCSLPLPRLLSIGPEVRPLSLTCPTNVHYYFIPAFAFPGHGPPMQRACSPMELTMWVSACTCLCVLPLPLQLRPGTVINCGVMYFNVKAYAEALPAMLSFADSLKWQVWAASFVWQLVGWQHALWSPAIAHHAQHSCCCKRCICLFSPLCTTIAAAVYA